MESESTSGCFDCNICLDFAQEPVVTPCGHLYCWPCIYKWLYIQSASLASDENAQCPVCKAGISHTTMIPLYGRGQTAAEQEGKTTPYYDIVIPPRPQASGSQAVVSSASQTSQHLRYRNPSQNQHLNPSPYSIVEDPSVPLLDLRSIHHSLIGLSSEMFQARVFRNLENMHAYSGANDPTGGAALRLRRQEMQVNKSLNRVSIFLFCCFLLCLIFF